MIVIAFLYLANKAIIVFLTLNLQNFLEDYILFVLHLAVMKLDPLSGLISRDSQD